MSNLFSSVMYRGKVSEEEFHRHLVELFLTTSPGGFQTHEDFVFYFFFSNLFFKTKLSRQSSRKF